MLIYTFIMTERTPKSLDGYRQIPNFIILYNSSQKYLQNLFLASLINKIDNTFREIVEETKRLYQRQNDR